MSKSPDAKTQGKRERDAAIRYRATLALREHLLLGNPVSFPEALLLFGVQNLSSELTRVKRDGFVVKSRRVPMAAVARRLREHASYSPPDGLPIREIVMTEYWIAS